MCAVYCVCVCARVRACGCVWVWGKIKENFILLQPCDRQVLWIKVTQKIVNDSLCVTN